MPGLTEQVRAEVEAVAFNPRPDNGPIYAFTQKYGNTGGGLKRFFTELAMWTSGIAGDYGVPLAVEALEALTASLRQGYADELAEREGVPTSRDIEIDTGV